MQNNWACKINFDIPIPDRKTKTLPFHLYEGWQKQFIVSNFQAFFDTRSWPFLSGHYKLFLTLDLALLMHMRSHKIKCGFSSCFSEQGVKMCRYAPDYFSCWNEIKMKVKGTIPVTISLHLRECNRMAKKNQLFAQGISKVLLIL